MALAAFAILVNPIRRQQLGALNIRTLVVHQRFLRDLLQTDAANTRGGPGEIAVH